MKATREPGAVSVLERMTAGGHELVVFCNDPTSGLRAVIAIHDTTLGPACGGLRLRPYETEEAAVSDALQLSRAMTYKSAIAGLPLGGGKAVAFAKSPADKTEELLRAFGRFVETLNGRYIAADDSGITPRDLTFVRRETEHVIGLPVSDGGVGDPYGLTGLGVCMGIKAAATQLWGTPSLAGRKVAIQGFGVVGRQTARHLLEEGAELVVCDVDAARSADARKLGATVVAPDSVYDVDCDVFSPCAFGGVLNDDTIPRLRCAIVAGAANNQLFHERHGSALHDRGILYAPDYVVNAGGVILGATEFDRSCDVEHAKVLTDNIFATTLRVFELAAEERVPTSVAADRMADRLLATARARAERARRVG